jgi:hypothetical protein
VLDRIGKGFACCGGISLLDLNDPEQIFDSSIVRINAGRIADQNSRTLEITGLNLLLDGK